MAYFDCVPVDAENDDGERRSSAETRDEFGFNIPLNRIHFVEILCIRAAVS
jgi:hypothetical protein